MNILNFMVNPYPLFPSENRIFDDLRRLHNTFLNDSKRETTKLF